jgi:hypothetical protein
MIVQYGKASNKYSHNNNHSKGDIINVARVVDRKSILMQITARAKVKNGFP